MDCIQNRTLVLLVALFLVTAPTVSAQSNQCSLAPEGLVSWWPGDGDASDIQDNNPGTPQNGVTYIAGNVGEGFLFDGVNDLVLVAPNSNLDILGDVTVQFWFKRNSLIVKEQYFVSQGVTTRSGVDVPSAYAVIISVADKVVGLFERGDGSNAGVVAPAPQDTLWHHCAYVRRGNTHEIFLDGVLGGSSVFTGTPGSSANLPLTMGAIEAEFLGPGQFTSFFDGLLDEVQVFNRALTAAEINEAFVAGDAGICKDEDGDGFRPPEDCDETDASINPDGLELPGNYVDEDCNGDLGDCNPCNTWRNHGEYIRCTSRAVSLLVSGGALTDVEGDALVSSAARSDVGKRSFVPPPECSQ